MKGAAGRGKHGKRGATAGRAKAKVAGAQLPAQRPAILTAQATVPRPIVRRVAVDDVPSVCPRCGWQNGRPVHGMVSGFWQTYRLIDQAPAVGCCKCGYVIYLDVDSFLAWERGK